MKTHNLVTTNTQTTLPQPHSFPVRNRQHSPTPPPFYRGFTLIELLVVIAIISILASILFPAFATAREKGRQTACLSNIKQITTAMMMYTQDYDEAFPGAGQAGANPICSIEPTNSWVLKQRIDENTNRCEEIGQPIPNGSLFAYVKNRQVYTCPSDIRGRSTTLSYSMNGRMDSMVLAGVDAPSDTILMVDEHRTLNDGYFLPPTENIPTDAVQQGYVGFFGAEQPTRQHNGGANFSFVDGHAKWFRPEQVHPTRFNALP
jgi:prepilin-type N-terminal cleavage/methylation domain-containing protein/prepilin-type processing-associated H-X9-DG protein